MASLPLIIAHRGASFDAPENTVAAFELAWTQGADGVEGDIHLTADGEVACIHDATTGRTGDRDVVVASSTLAELQGADVGVWKGPRFAGERVATLAEVLDLVPAGKMIFVELKAGLEMVGPVAAALARSRVGAGQVRILCFDAGVVSACKRAVPEVKVHWLVEFSQGRADVGSVLSRALEIGADGLNCKADAEVLTPEFVARAGKTGLETAAWTVDEAELATELARAGVGALTTNRPALIRQCLGG